MTRSLGRLVPQAVACATGAAAALLAGISPGLAESSAQKWNVLLSGISYDVTCDISGVCPLNLADGISPEIRFAGRAVTVSGISNVQNVDYCPPGYHEINTQDLNTGQQGVMCSADDHYEHIPVQTKRCETTIDGNASANDSYPNATSATGDYTTTDCDGQKTSGDLVLTRVDETIHGGGTVTRQLGSLPSGADLNTDSETRLLIRYDNGAVINIAPDSEFIARASQSPTFLGDLVRGALRDYRPFRNSQVPQPSTIQMRCGGGTCWLTPKGTEFVARVVDAHRSEVEVLTGTVSVTGSDGQAVDVGPNQKLTLTDGIATAGPASFDPSSIDRFWEQPTGPLGLLSWGLMAVAAGLIGLALLAALVLVLVFIVRPGHLRPSFTFARTGVLPAQRRASPGVESVGSGFPARAPTAAPPPPPDLRVQQLTASFREAVVDLAWEAPGFDFNRRGLVGFEVFSDDVSSMPPIRQTVASVPHDQLAIQSLQHIPNKIYGVQPIWRVRRGEDVAVIEYGPARLVSLDARS